MEAIQRWMMSVAAMSVLSALCQLFMPEGAAKRVGRMTCALLLFVVIVRPVQEIDTDVFLSHLSDSAARYASYSEELQQTNQSLTEDIIARQTAAYIEDKAAQSGLSCSVQVQCTQQDGVPVPSALTVTGVHSSEERQWIAELADRELGIGENRICFTEEGGA